METGKTGNNKTMMIVIIALLVLLLAAIATVSFLFLNAMGTQKPAEGPVFPQTTTLKPEQIDIIPLEGVINTNLATDEDGMEHLIRVGIQLGVNNTQKEESTKFIDLLKAKEVIIRNTALSVIRSKTYSQMNRPDGPSTLRDDLLSELQDIFQNNLLVDIYVDDFIVQ